MLIVVTCVWSESSVAQTAILRVGQIRLSSMQRIDGLMVGYRMEEKQGNSQLLVEEPNREVSRL